ncbi:hypothetical protein NDA10_006385 [Ustilago hordei]|nr:hypothetical protein NDA10_006385 [Ustilago hordei]
MGNLLSAVTRLKPEISSSISTITDSVELCDSTNGITLGTININVMMTPRSGVSVDDDEVDGVGDKIGDVDDNEVDGVGDKVGGVDDNEVDGVGDKVGGVNTSVQCVDLMLEVIPGPQWTTAFGSIYIRTANLLWAPSDVR